MNLVKHMMYLLLSNSNNDSNNDSDNKEFLIWLLNKINIIRKL